MCKRAGLIVGFDYSKKTAYIARGTCDSWTCPECAKRMASRWRMRAEGGVRAMLAAGDPVDFVTITSHEKLKTFEQTEHVFRSAWATLYAALKRKKPTLQYFIVPEKHKDGRMHVHIIWNAGVTKRWLKDACRKRGLGYQVDVSNMTEAGYAGRYVTKYLSKSLGADMPERFRRVRTSQGWYDLPAPETGSKLEDWMYITRNDQLSALYDVARIKGITLLDQKTMLVWDDIDIEQEIADANDTHA